MLGTCGKMENLLNHDGGRIRSFLFTGQPKPRCELKSVTVHSNQQSNLRDPQSPQRCRTDMTSRNSEEDTWQSMSSPKRIFWGGFTELTRNHADNAGRDSPLFRAKIQQGDDEGLGGIFPGTTSHVIHPGDKQAPRRPGAPNSKNLS
jgi:hypothetical protein